MTLPNALTIDVEDYYHVTNFAGRIRADSWDEYPSRVVDSTQTILRLLADRKIHGTFFVLGYVARRHPELVKTIAAAGHEIASHSYWHKLVYAQSPAEFRADLCASRNILEDLTGRPITAYRAPTFSITRNSRWALEILAEEGFSVDSSVFPIRHDRYGNPSADVSPHLIELAAGQLWEVPMTVYQLGGSINVPAAGGGYFRLFPYQLTRWLLGQVIARSQRPVVFYVHPWEFDPDQPRMQAGSRVQRLRHYVNLDKTVDKFARLLDDFSWGRLDDVLTAYRNSNLTGVERPFHCTASIKA